MGTTTSVSVATSTQIQVNDLLVAGVTWSGSGISISSTDGWSTAVPQFSQPGFGNQVLLFKVATAADVGKTFIWRFSSGTFSFAGIIDYRGADPAAPIDAIGTTNSAQGSGTVAITASSITTVANSDTLIWVGGGVISSGSAAFATPPAAFTLGYASSFSAGAAPAQQQSFRNNVAPGPTGNVSTTVAAGSATLFWHAVMIAIKPSAPLAPATGSRPAHDPRPPAVAGSHRPRQRARGHPPLTPSRASSKAGYLR